MPPHKEFRYYYEIVMSSAPTALDKDGCDGIYVKEINRLEYIKSGDINPNLYKVVIDVLSDRDVEEIALGKYRAKRANPNG